jgi:uncharacterized membrane protein
MHRSLRTLALAAMLSLAAAAPATAAPQAASAGSFTPTGQTLTIRTAGGNTIIDGTGTHSWSGSLTGTSVVDVHFVIHPDGTLTFQGFVTFTGSTPCGDGTVTFEAQGAGPVPGPITGTFATTDQASASLPLHARVNLVLFLTPAGNAVGTYAGDIRCG